MHAEHQIRRSLQVGLCLLISLFLFTADLSAQEEEERRVPRSQHGMVEQTVDRTIIRIEYHRPQARGRVLFGENSQVVQDGRVWDMGANRATSIEFTDDVIFVGHELPAGKYSIWAMPQSDAPWQFVVNTQWDVFHIPYPGEATEVFRTEITPEEGSYMDFLTFHFSDVGPDRATLAFQWGDTLLNLPIELVGSR